MVEVLRHDGWSSFLESRAGISGRLILFSTRGAESLAGFSFELGDCLLFGRESAGATDEAHEAADGCVRIPLEGDARSLNVSMAAGVALWEALRQTGALPQSLVSAPGV
jgi:tRNA (cytidine/uridine-2'-O-)-methyltransferase